MQRRTYYYLIAIPILTTSISLFLKQVGVADYIRIGVSTIIGLILIWRTLDAAKGKSDRKLAGKQEDTRASGKVPDTE